MRCSQSPNILLPREYLFWLQFKWMAVSTISLNDGPPMEYGGLLLAGEEGIWLWRLTSKHFPPPGLPYWQRSNNRKWIGSRYLLGHLQSFNNGSKPIFDVVWYQLQKKLNVKFKPIENYVGYFSVMILIMLGNYEIGKHFDKNVQDQ